MAKKAVVIEVRKEYTFNYDPNSKAFKEALAGFRESIAPKGTEESMLLHVAYHVERFGADCMVEGVGYIYEGGSKKHPYSGISIENWFPDPEVDFV